jgi:DNA recombination protein RmuC
MENAFKSLSADALKSNNQSFLDLARTSLDEFQQGAQGRPREAPGRDRRAGRAGEGLARQGGREDRALEKSREQAYGEIRQQFTQMAEVQRSCATRLATW